ncbi:MAG: hypothetical protein K0M55_19500 [Rhizobium sp.]|nr:hypothetical protein [Rhizobium sp.]
MNGSATELSHGLQAMISDFAIHQDEPEGISIDQDQLLKLLSILRVMQEMATNLEIEVRCLRDMEAGRGARAFLDDEATAHLADLLPNVGGNVIRPDFGGRS